MAEVHEQEFKRNFQRWQVLGIYTQPNPEHIWQIPTFEGHVEQLTGFLTDRAQWMYDYLND
jgi:hypothetical protein